MSVLQKIEDIEAEMAKTQKNKATAYVPGKPGRYAFSLRSPPVLWEPFHCISRGRALQAS